MIHKNDSDWQQSSPQIFWGEIAPCNHMVQIYESDEVFMDSLEEFVGSGLNMGESVVLIATAEHLESLEKRLSEHGFDLEGLKRADKLISLNAEDTLAKFMVNGWPDEALFRNVVSGVIERAKKNAKPIRAFGEMVALLWAQGHCGATVRLEHLWNEFSKLEAFSLYCAYPKSGFTKDANQSILDICDTHTHVIGGWQKNTVDIYHKEGGHYADHMHNPNGRDVHPELAGAGKFSPV